MPQEFEYDGGAPVGEKEKAVLVGLSSPVLGPDESSDEDTLDELEALLETAGVIDAVVSHEKGEATAKCDDALTFETLKTVVEAQGYKVL